MIFLSKSGMKQSQRNKSEFACLWLHFFHRGDEMPLLGDEVDNRVQDPKKVATHDWGEVNLNITLGATSATNPTTDESPPAPSDNGNQPIHHFVCSSPKQPMSSHSQKIVSFNPSPLQKKGGQVPPLKSCYHRAGSSWGLLSRLGLWCNGTGVHEGLLSCSEAHGKLEMTGK